MMDKNCIQCGKHFIALRNTAKYCSNACKQRYNKDPREPGMPVLTLECENCGKSFSSRRKNTKYCSKSCAMKAWRARDRVKKHVGGDIMRYALTRKFGEKVAA